MNSASPWPHADFPEWVDLPPIGHLPALRHLFEPDAVWAVKAALGARRPLLVRGEPGTGKSQLARAAAYALKRPLVSTVVTARTEPQDLHWSYDAVARLGQAQLLAVAGRATGGEPAPLPAQRQAPAGEPAAEVADLGGLRLLDESRFLRPGVLWWVFDWCRAVAQHEHACIKGARPQKPPDEWQWKPSHGTVLLVDEIDKADPDLPNGLLESLGDGRFHVPYLDDPVCCRPDDEPPLVVITTNEERELPAAFVRRCLVLHLELPKGQELLNTLVERGRAHFGERCSQAVYEKAATLLLHDREATRDEALVRPGQAEYLDILRALIDVTQKTGAEPLTVLESLSKFALQKNPTVRR